AMPLQTTDSSSPYKDNTPLQTITTRQPPDLRQICHGKTTYRGYAVLLHNARPTLPSTHFLTIEEHLYLGLAPKTQLRQFPMGGDFSYTDVYSQPAANPPTPMPLQNH